MNREYDIRDCVLLGYRAFGGTIRGKTMLQKRMYFLSVKLDLDLRFGPHYYGPYSADVAAANVDFTSLGFLFERSATWGFDHRSFEKARYDYELTNAGWRLAERKAQATGDLWIRIEGAAKSITDAGDLDYMELAIAAKAYFALMHLQGKAPVDEIAKLLPKFGWSVTKEQLSSATSFLAKAGLVTPDAASAAGS
jgi:uncharacterized protein YwgA